MRRQVSAEAGVAKQTGVEGRNAHHRRCLRQVRDDCVKVKLRQKDHPPADSKQYVGGDEETMRVKDRQRVQQHIAAAEPPCLDQRIGVRQKVVMAQHRALGAPRRSRRVKDRGQIVRAARCSGEIVRRRRGALCQRAAATGCVNRQQGYSPTLDHRAKAGLCARVADRCARFRVT